MGATKPLFNRGEPYLTILMPCAGEGKRFREKGYTVPKPLIPIGNGKSTQPMLKSVIENIRPSTNHWFCFVIREQDKHELIPMLHEWAPRCGILTIDKTEGAAMSCLAASTGIDPNGQLLVANCDQLIEEPPKGEWRDWIYDLIEKKPEVHGRILTMRKEEDDKRWSYVVPDDERHISLVSEKVKVSNRATTGHYYFSKASYFFDSIRCMIGMDDRTNGEFYVAPSYNYMIAGRKVIHEVRIEDYGAKFVGLGTPEDVEAYNKQ